MQRNYVEILLRKFLVAGTSLQQPTETGYMFLSVRPNFGVRMK
jgi:hypothetical protein